ncbi:putative signal transducing protein [Psychroserpens sp. MEBiC05023]
MTDSTYTKIFSGSFIIVQLAMDRLQSAGINAIIKDESESGRLAGFGASIQGYQELYVSNEELEQAQVIIADLNEDLAS